VSSLSGNLLAPLIWLGFSMTLYLTAGYLRIQVSAHNRASPLLSPVVLRILEAGFYVGAPYVALLQGDILLRWLGLSGMDWIQGLGIGVTLGAGALALAGLAFRYAMRGEPAAAQPPAHVSRLHLLWDAFTLQVHWAFYRALMIQVIGDVYWGAFAGLTLVALEYLLSAETRRRLRTPAAPRVVAHLTLAALTAILFVYVGNLPLLIAFHWVFEIALNSSFIPWPEASASLSRQ
jgi:hypothetical protein